MKGLLERKSTAREVEVVVECASGKVMRVLGRKAGPLHATDATEVKSVDSVTITVNSQCTSSISKDE